MLVRLEGLKKNLRETKVISILFSQVVILASVSILWHCIIYKRYNNTVTDQLI